MKLVYPIIIYGKRNIEKTHIVYIPDFNVTTQGVDLEECIEMAKDLMELMYIDLKEDNKEIPKPYSSREKYLTNLRGRRVLGLEIEKEELVEVTFWEYNIEKGEVEMDRKDKAIPVALAKLLVAKDENGKDMGINEKFKYLICSIDGDEYYILDMFVREGYITNEEGAIIFNFINKCTAKEVFDIYGSIID